MSREMVNSGIPWIGDIPRGWRTSTLLQVLRARISDGPHETPNLIDNGIPFISVDSLNESENIDFSVVRKFISTEDFKEYSKKTCLEQGDILFTKSATIGKTAIVKDDVFMIWSPIAILKPNNLVNNKFLYHIVSNGYFKEYICQLSTFNTQFNIGMRTLEKAKICFPSIPEQQKIASFLDKKCAEIDEMIALQEKVVEELKAYKQSVITEAVTKGLNPDVPLKDSGIEWIGKIPEHWRMYRIKYNTFLKGRIGWQGLNSNDFIDEGYCLITGTDFDNKGGINWDTCYRISKERFDEDELLHVKNGDLLMTKDGTVGKMAYIQNLPEEASLNSHLLIIRQTTDIISNEFLYWVMLSNVFKRFCLIYQSGSIMSSISQSTLGMLSCYCPSVDEQNKIASYLNTKCSHIDSLINIKQSKIDSLKEYKKSIIYEYVTGKKEVVD